MEGGRIQVAHGHLSLVDRWAATFGLHGILRERASRRLTILMYHRVLPDALAEAYPLHDLVVRESLFREQVRWLARHARVLPLAAGVQALRTQLRHRRPIVCLTFDDGYLDNFEIAAPTLETAGLRGTFFVTTGFVEGGALWFDEAARAWLELGAVRWAALLGSGEPPASLMDALGLLKGMGHAERQRAIAALRAALGPPRSDLLFAPMRPAHLRLLCAQGHEVGSHTVSHAICTQLDEHGLAHELLDSRARIAAWTGQAPMSFCYPNGNFSATTRCALVGAGYALACTTLRGTNVEQQDPLALRRIKVAETSTTSPGHRHDDRMFAGEVWGFHNLLRQAASLGRRGRSGSKPLVSQEALY